MEAERAKPDIPMHTASARLQVRAPFSLFATAVSHGWYQTSPFRWVQQRGVLQRAERLRDGRVLLVEMCEERSARRGYRDVIVSVSGNGAGDPGVSAEMTRRCSTMLHLAEDLRGFYALCRRHAVLRSALHAGAGRCMRSSSLWEDVVKTILGTNTLWRQAVVMINRLCGLGPLCPSEPALRGWPTPEEVERAGEGYLRDHVRAGYRSRYVLELAGQLRRGDLDLEVLEACAGRLGSEELYKSLIALPGIGKSSAHFLMNLLGHYDHISIDSATYAYATRALFKGKRPTEGQIRRRFARFGRWQSLVYWFTRWAPRLAWWEDAKGRASS